MSKQSMEARTSAEPGPECYCGEELKEVPLPGDLAELSGRKMIWAHVHSGDTRCYPDEDEKATAEPAEDLVARAILRRRSGLVGR
jgi:hypothetical protein